MGNFYLSLPTLSGGALFVTLALVGCNKQKPLEGSAWDSDGDGFPAAQDCDDDDDDVYPGADERCDDGIDNDCDSNADSADLDCQAPVDTGFMSDVDADGYTLPDDCDDNDPDVSPGATERCEVEGEVPQDDDCGGTLESDNPSVEASNCTPWYADRDGDGYGGADDEDTVVCTCLEPAPTEDVSQWSESSADCDDTNALIYPGAPTGCATDDIDDANCDGDDDPKPTDCTWWYRDEDRDGKGDPDDPVCECEAPSAEYVTNDDGCASDEMYTYYLDADGDGYGADVSPDGVSPVSRKLCSAIGYYNVRVPGDCDDADPAVHPAAEDDCGGTDYDCDNAGVADDPTDEQDSVDAENCTTFYYDGDLDGYGTDSADSDSERCLCAEFVEGAVAPITDGYRPYTSTVNTDCDDSTDLTYPGADETCDEADNDCDGTVDDGAFDNYYYYDGDGDSQGAGPAFELCEWFVEGKSYELNNTDCDDANPKAFLRSDSGNNDIGLCDGADNDCDGTVDENLLDTYTIDSDRDGFGTDDPDDDTIDIMDLCIDDHSGYAKSATDCDDANPNVYPYRAELCNSIDDDCDTYVDEELRGTYYRDADDDGFGAGTAYDLCNSDRDGYSASNTDCDDTSRYVKEPQMYFPDNDNDDYGDESSSGELACPADVRDGSGTVFGWVSNSEDCDDSETDIHPEASEVCNGADDDCNGISDDGLYPTLYYADDDEDEFGDPDDWARYCRGDRVPSKYVADDTDCDDGNDSTYPGAPEVCDGADNDCDEMDDESDGYSATDPMPGCCNMYHDVDNDGYGDPDSPASGTCTCTPTPLQSVSPTDCDDTDPSAYPTAPTDDDAVDCEVDDTDTEFAFSEYGDPIEGASPDSCWLLAVPETVP